MQIPLEEAELSQFLKHYMNQPRKGNSWWWQRSVKCIEWWPQYSQVNRGGVKQPLFQPLLSQRGELKPRGEKRYTLRKCFPLAEELGLEFKSLHKGIPPLKKGNMAN